VGNGGSRGDLGIRSKERNEVVKKAIEAHVLGRRRRGKEKKKFLMRYSAGRGSSMSPYAARRAVNHHGEEKRERTALLQATRQTT